MFIKIIAALLAIINIIGFVIVAVDKHKARKRKWRIPEKTFFLICVLGGCPGVYAGLILFSHKTKHWYFMIGIPMIFLLQLLAVCYFLFLGGTHPFSSSMHPLHTYLPL